jgi:hypothetical protein
VSVINSGDCDVGSASVSNYQTLFRKVLNYNYFVPESPVLLQCRRTNAGRRKLPFNDTRARIQGEVRISFPSVYAIPSRQRRLSNARFSL